MKTYETDEKVSDSYQTEIDSHGDIRVLKNQGPCSYGSYTNGPFGRRINTCGSLNCSYYQRICGNTSGMVLGSAATAGTAVGFGLALFATPFTGGLSLLAATGLSAAASASAVGGTLATAAGANATLDGIENELKLKWENEQIREKINKLQSELNEVKSKYRYGELSNYRLREIIREKEEKIRELKEENERISGESWERWQAIERLEEIVRELKSML